MEPKKNFSSSQPPPNRTPADLEAKIKQRYWSDPFASLRDIGREFNVSGKTVKRIVARARSRP